MGITTSSTVCAVDLDVSGSISKALPSTLDSRMDLLLLLLCFVLEVFVMGHVLCCGEQHSATGAIGAATWPGTAFLCGP